ncbi:MAG TPA: 16S rRNA (guanine(527)-N(7))-methyltransferase RsmG [Candidatus Nanopelagicales bacterium]|nr:16S rRNA (guanine(527)-N(7))-methyltransferase RsmG [Candidatus Nanopelagicales bacterium]
MVSRETPPPELPAWLAPAAGGLHAYVDLLIGPGTERGLLGPREAPRIWDRHVLNCAVVADPAEELIPHGSRVADIGSGAGLPGLVWALARPDLQVVLIESLLRRVTFLTECVHELGLSEHVTVVRARAEEVADRAGGVDVVTARAVAPLGTIAQWAGPLLSDGGILAALKGASAQEEIQRDAEQLGAAGLVDARVVMSGTGVVDPPTTVVLARKVGAQ